MGSGCGDGIVDQILRPPGKLPVPVALNAPSPTLFTDNYTLFYRKCKYPFYQYPGKDPAQRIFQGNCRIFLPVKPPISLSFLPASHYNGTT